MRKCNSLFSQLLRLFPRWEFQELVTKHEAERGAKGFDCLDAVYRDALLSAWQGGVGRAPACSTLSYDNAHRSHALFQGVFMQLLTRCQTIASPKPFRFKHKLYSLDTTVIDLCLEMFDWAIRDLLSQGQHPCR